MKNMNWLVLVGVLILNTAHAGEKGGNGGWVVQNSNGKVYLIDFAEFGIEDHPTIHEYDHVDSKITETAEQTIGSAINSNKISNLNLLKTQLSFKLMEVKEQYPVFAEILSRSMKHYLWIFLNFPITPVRDFDSIIQGDFYPIANRGTMRIQIHLDMFNSLSVENQVGLIFHEILYAMSKEQKNSDEIRPLTGLIFTKSIPELPHSLLTTYLRKAQILETLINPSKTWYVAESQEPESFILSTNVRASFCIYGGQIGKHRGCQRQACLFDDVINDRCNIDKICSNLEQHSNKYNSGFFLEIFDTQSIYFSADSSYGVHVNENRDSTWDRQAPAGTACRDFFKTKLPELKEAISLWSVYKP